ncbi:DNA methyltransferase [Sphingobacterium siyangense]
MKLLEEKVNVSKKLRSNFFNWRGQFTPEFIDYLIGEFSGKSYTIADPFAGSGTVLYEGLIKSHKVIGFELNPSAFYISSFYTLTKLSLEERKRLVQKIRIYVDLALKLENLTKDRIYDFFVKEYKNEIANEIDKIFIVNLLIEFESSKARLELKEKLLKSLEYLESLLLFMPKSDDEHIEVHNEDCRKIGEFYKEKIDIVITSPPYINVFNYHQNYRGIIEKLNYDILKIANSEIGSNRKHRGNRVYTVVQYTLDMYECLSSIKNALKMNGIAILVVGRVSKVCKIEFYNSLIIKDIIESINSFDILSERERTFKNKFGQNIVEDILIIRKRDGGNPLISPHEIAIKHLNSALVNLLDENQIRLIEQTIHNISKIKLSPIL